MSPGSDTVSVMKVKGFARTPHAPFDLELDPGQRAVVEATGSEPMLVIGAPGTGKTVALIETFNDRVHNKHVSARSILTLCPNRRIASKLRDRIAARLETTLEGPAARTINSLAFEVVSFARSEAGSPAPKLLTGSDQDADIAQLLEGHSNGAGPNWPESLSPQVRTLRGFRTELRETLMRITEHSFSTDAVRQVGLSHSNPEWLALAEFRDEYLKVMASLRPDQLDVAELCIEAARIIADGLAPEWVKQLRLVFFDDIQEVNQSTISILRALASQGTQLILFGNPDVTANIFRGGDDGLLSRLDSELGVQLRQTRLNICHRTNGEILDLAARVTSLIGTSGITGQRNPQSDRGPNSECVLIQRDTATNLWTDIARKLRLRHLQAGVQWGQMAVIVRNGSLIPQICRVLNLAEVPTRITSADLPLRDERSVKAILGVLEVAIGRKQLEPQVSEDLLLGPFGGLDKLQLRSLKLSLRNEEIIGGGSRSADELLAEALSAPNRLVTIDSAPARLASKLADTLSGLRDMAAKGALVEELLWFVWERSEPAKTWGEQSSGRGIVAAEANRNLDGILALFAAAKRFGERQPDSPVSVFLSAVLDSEVPEDTLAPLSLAQSVLVTTPNGVIGQEFDTVVVGSLQDGVWPNLRPRGSLFAADELVRVLTGSELARTDLRRIELHNELRLFLLSLTRARENLTFAAVANDDEVPSPFFNLLSEVKTDDTQTEAAHTLRGMVGEIRRRLVSNPTNEDACNLAALAELGVAGASPTEWQGLLPPSTNEPLYLPDEVVPLSPSKLGRFVESPMDWFIDSVALGSSVMSAAIGTIMHWALENFEGQTADEIWTQVESRWAELPFEADWLSAQSERNVRQMVEALAEYLADFQESGGDLLKPEESFQVDLGRVVLNGKIDRIERSKSGEVVIADLKTGKSALSNEEVLDHPQLRSYQFALSEGALASVVGDDEVPESGGAKLIWVSRSLKPKKYRQDVQGPLNQAQLDEFRELLMRTAEGMAVGEYSGAAEAEDSYGNSAPKQDWHRTRAVTSD